MEHLDALNLRLSDERERLAAAKTDKERAMRQVWVDGIAREISREQARQQIYRDRMRPCNSPAVRFCSPNKDSA